MAPLVVGDRAIDRWMAIEMSKLRDALVTQPRSLSELMLEAQPSVLTRGGLPHAFDKAVLSRFHALLSPLERRKLRLPVSFYVDSDVPNDAYVTDDAALRLLSALGEAPAGAELREGRWWLGHSRARGVAQRHPTSFQFVLL